MKQCEYVFYVTDEAKLYHKTYNSSALLIYKFGNYVQLRLIANSFYLYCHTAIDEGISTCTLFMAVKRQMLPNVHFLMKAIKNLLPIKRIIRSNNMLILRLLW